MRNVSSNWAYCVVLAPGAMPGSTASWMDVPLVHRRYTHAHDKHWPTTPPNYLAFRWRGKVRQFNHVENTVIVDDLSEALPTLFMPGAVTGPHAVHELGPPIELPRPLPNGRIYATARVWVMIDLLFTATNLKDATVLSQARRQTAGEAREPPT